MSPLPLAEVRSLLRAWAYWATAYEPHGPAPTCCRSLESHYMSPQHWHAEEPRPPEPDEHLGLRIERLIRLLPDAERACVRVWYVHGGAGHATDRADPYLLAARRVGVGTAERFSELLTRAERLIALGLDKPEIRGFNWGRVGAS